MVQVIQQENPWAQAAGQLGGGLVQGYTERSDENAIRRAIEELGPDAKPRDVINTLTGLKTYGSGAKQRAVQNYQKSFESEIKAEKNRIDAAKQGTEEETEARKQQYREAGYPEYEVKLLTDPKTTPGEKNQIAQQHKDLISRQIRKPLSESPKAIEQQEMPQEQVLTEDTPQETPKEAEAVKKDQDEAVKEIKQESAKPESWPKIEPPSETTPAEKEKWRASNQRENNKLLQETQKKINAHENTLVRANILTELNDTGKLPSGLGSLIINPDTGEPYGVASLTGQVNKETQRFVKTLNDFLIDAKNYFGARVTNFDVTAFKSRLPTLLNSEEGRRVIIQQMKLMEELQMVHDNGLADALKHYGRNASYSDVQKSVDDRIGSQKQAVIKKINDVDQASDYIQLVGSNPKLKGYKVMQNQETGKFRAFPESDVSKAKSRGYILW